MSSSTARPSPTHDPASAPPRPSGSSYRSDCAARLKLRGALRELHLSVNGMVALDLGAAAGGFTQALLEAGAARVYAVDAGSGQLRGWLRADPRVVNLERTNLADVGPDLVHEPVDLVTIDLSYLALADALPQIDPAVMAPAATVLALVKPTYELRSGALAADPQSVADAIEKVARTVIRLGWSVTATVPSCLRGSRGATEVFMQATHGRAKPIDRRGPG